MLRIPESASIRKVKGQQSKICDAHSRYFIGACSCDQLHETVRGKSAVASGKNVKQLIVELNPLLRGWGNYFRTGNFDREFNGMDHFVIQRLRRWQYRRGGQQPTRRPSSAHEQSYAMGLQRLMGTVRYPTQATHRRSSLSRVPENGTHGLKGDAMETGQPR